VNLLLLGAEFFHSGFDGFQVGKIHLQEQSFFAGLLRQLFDSFINFVRVSGGNVDFRIAC
jgi:hypothetical protein